MNTSRERNIGWRIDYILANKELKVLQANIYPDIHGSDHCPISALIKLWSAYLILKVTIITKVLYDYSGSFDFYWVIEGHFSKISISKVCYYAIVCSIVVIKLVLWSYTFKIIWWGVWFLNSKVFPVLVIFVCLTLLHYVAH